MDEFKISLLFGGFILVIFAWDQFKRPSYEPSRDLTRLIELLAPTDMRKAGVYLRAYLFYVAILLLIYLTLCVYATLPILSLLGFEGGPSDTVGGNVGADKLPMTGQIGWFEGEAPPPGSGETLAGDSDTNSGNPELPLFISLAMVGLAPAVPILQKLEEKIRFAAHRMSGIPTRLLLGTRQLVLKRLVLRKAADDGLLIPAQDWERLRHYREMAEKILDDPSGFDQDIAKIVALQNWILREKLQFNSASASPGIVALERELATRTDQLIFALDAISGFDTRLEMFSDAQEGPAHQSAAWDKLSKDADRLATDLCVLLMLYSEHGVIPLEELDEAAERVETAVNAEEHDPSAQKNRALALFRDFLGDAARQVDEGTVRMVIWGRATLASILVAFCWGLFVAQDTQLVGDDNVPQTVNRFYLGYTYTLSALLTYALSMLVAVSMHQGGYQARTWHNVFDTNWSQWVMPMALLTIFSALTALVCHVAYNVFWTVQAVGFDLVRENYHAVLVGAVNYEGPRAMLGPILGLGVVLATDSWRAEARGKKMRDRAIIAGITAAMFLWGAISRGLSTQVAAPSRGDPVKPLWQLMMDDRLMLGAGVLAGLIGLVSIYFVQQTLRHEFPRHRIAIDLTLEKSPRFGQSRPAP